MLKKKKKRERESLKSMAFALLVYFLPKVIDVNVNGKMDLNEK